MRGGIDLEVKVKQVLDKSETGEWALSVGIEASVDLDDQSHPLSCRCQQRQV